MEDLHFTEMFENHPSKLVAAILSMLLMIVGTMLEFTIVRYERDKSNRTLINQLLSSLITLSNIPSFLIQVAFTFHYLVTPLPAFVCYVDLVLRPTIVMMFILFLDAMAITRFMFIFHTKNPTGFQDDFWNLFLSLWITRYFFVG